MAGRPLATAFVRIRMLVDPREARADVDSALNAAGLDKSGQAQGEKAGAAMAAGLKQRLAKDIGKSAGQVNIDVSVSDLVAQRSLTSLKAAQDDLARKLTTIRVGADDKTAQAALLRINAQMDTLSKKLATPGVELKGADRVQAQILTIGAAMDKLSAKVTADAEKAAAELAKITTPDAKGSLLSRVGSFITTAGGLIPGAGGGGGAAGVAGAAGPAAAGGGGGAAIAGGVTAAGVGVLASGVGGIIPLLTAATLALGSFGALALPTLSNLRAAMSSVSAATDVYAQASQNLNTAIHQSPADMAAYQGVLKGLEPDLAVAAQLLTNQSLTWQDMTPAQQRSVIALRNNAAAYKTLLPDQKNALNALIKEGNAWSQLSPQQQTAAGLISALSAKFGKLADLLAPDVFKVFNAGLRVANTLLPFLLPLAQSITGTLVKLLGNVDQFGKSAGFRDFIAQMTQLAGPALQAVGEGVGKVIVALGKLVLALVSPNGLRALRGLFDGVAAALVGLAWLFTNGLPVMERYFHNFAVAVDEVRGFLKTLTLAVLEMAKQILVGFKIAADGVLTFIGVIVDGAAKAFGWIPSLGPKLKSSAKAFDEFRSGVDSSLNKAIGTVDNWIGKLTQNNSISARAARQIVGDFAAQQQAASKASAGLATYTDTIRVQGITSNAARQARQNLINDMIGAGVKAATARADVGRYTDAIAKNGVGSQQALQAREKLVSDIFATSVKAQNGRADLDRYTTAVRDNGAKSDAAKSARAKLIGDLQAAGLTAQRANDLVNGLTTGIQHIPGSKTVDIHVSGTGNWSISQSKNTNFGSGLLAGTKFAGAAGGIIPGYAPGVDSVLAAVSPGEAIIVPEAVRAIGAGNIMAINRAYAPGRTSQGMAFAGGGLVAGNFAGLSPWTTGQYDATVRAMTTQVGSAISDAINTAVSQARAAAQAATAGTGGFLGDSGVRSGSAALAQAFARSIMGQYGWGANQWPPWLYLGNQESGWSAYAVNQSSGAYGIGQSLGHGHPYNLGDYQNQVIWMANYIKGRYGTPAVAWGHEQAFNWYGGGGTIMEPVTGVGLRTGRRYGFGENGPETVTPGIGGGDGASALAELRALRAAVEALPGRIAAGVAAGVAAPANTAAQAARIGAR
jgi:predicted RecA/RadA family phage recombinase